MVKGVKSATPDDAAFMYLAMAYATRHTTMAVNNPVSPSTVVRLPIGSVDRFCGLMLALWDNWQPHLARNPCRDPLLWPAPILSLGVQERHHQWSSVVPSLWGHAGLELCCSWLL